MTQSVLFSNIDYIPSCFLASVRLFALTVVPVESRNVCGKCLLLSWLIFIIKI